MYDTPRATQAAPPPPFTTPSQPCMPRLDEKIEARAEVASLLSLQNTRLQFLLEMISQLDAKVNPALAPAVPIGNEQAGKPSPASQLGICIDENTELVNRAISWVMDLRQRATL